MQRRCLCPVAAGGPHIWDRQKTTSGSPGPGRDGWGWEQERLCGPYLCRRFLRFLVWFKADLDIFRSLEETSSESEKRAGSGMGSALRSAGVGWGDPTFCSLCEPQGPVCGLHRSSPGSGSPSPSLRPGRPSPYRLLKPQILNKFRCKRGQGRGAPAGRDVGERGRHGVAGTPGGTPSFEIFPSANSPQVPDPKVDPRITGLLQGSWGPGKGWRLRVRCLFCGTHKNVFLFEFREPAMNHFSLSCYVYYIMMAGKIWGNTESRGARAHRQGSGPDRAKGSSSRVPEPEKNPIHGAA